jgi:hypothetical protein
VERILLAHQCLAPLHSPYSREVIVLVKLEVRNQEHIFHPVPSELHASPFLLLPAAQNRGGAESKHYQKFSPNMVINPKPCSTEKQVEIDIHES